METRFVPDAPGAWLVYDLGSLVLALPPEFRAAADAVAAMPRTGVAGVIAALRSSGIADAAPFAVLDAAGNGVHLALRGPATVAVGAETLTGLGADPWLERVVPGVMVARLTVPGGEWTLAFAASASASPTSARASASASAASVPAPPAAPASAPVFVAPPPPLLEPRHEITEVPELELSAPPASAPVPPSPPPPADAEIGEHDGHTVLAEDLPRPADDKTVVVDEIAQLRARRSEGLAPPAAAPPPPPAPPRGPALSLELPDGTRQPLDGVVLVGRAPTAAADGSARLVRLSDGDISRNHARVANEGGTVVVTDLGSRNGTVVRIPGRPPQKLRGNEPTPVLVGTVIDFGGGVELSVREG